METEKYIFFFTFELIMIHWVGLYCKCVIMLQKLFTRKSYVTTYWFFVKNAIFSVKSQDLHKDTVRCHDNKHLPNEMIFEVPIGYGISNATTKLSDFWMIRNEDMG